MNSLLVTGVAIDAWKQLLRTNAMLSARLECELLRDHGLTLSDYDVLVQLDNSESGLKMSELSERALLTRSGMTRLVAGLEKDGLVSRASCQSDARVSYACMTSDGKQRLAEARNTHHQGIRELFANHFDESELAQLNELLARIEMVDTDCDACLE